YRCGARRRAPGGRRHLPASCPPPPFLPPGRGAPAGGPRAAPRGAPPPPRTALRPALPAHGPDLLPLPPDASPPRRAVGGGFVAPAVAERRRIPDARDGRAPRPGGRLLRGGLATLGRAPTEQPRAARPEREQRAPL